MQLKLVVPFSICYCAIAVGATEPLPRNIFNWLETDLYFTKRADDGMFGKIPHLPGP